MNSFSRDPKLEKQIDAYVRGLLSEKEAEQLWVELLKNPHYIDLLETELAVKSIVEEGTSEKKAAPVHAFPFVKGWKWIAAAAAVALLVVAINLFKVNNTQNLQVQALPNINMAQNLASPQVLRSQEVTLSSADSLLNLSFKAAISGDINRALALYNEVASQYPESPQAAQAWLNIGIIKYNSEDYKQAASAFEQALSRVKNDPVVKEKSFWYLGNSYIQLNKLKKAREAIHNTYSMDGIYRKPAFRLLRKLDHKLGNVDFDNFEQQMKESQ